MKDTIRKTRSATRFEKSQHSELSIKREEGDLKTIEIGGNQHEFVAMSSSDSVVKVEEKEADLKDQPPEPGKEKGLK